MVALAILWGVFAGTMVETQVVYCECFRDDFNGKLCQSIKGDGAQGSCKK